MIESLSASQLRLKTSDNFLISSPLSLTQIQPALTSITIAGRNIELFVSEEETLEGPTTTTVELAEAVSIENTAETISAINNGLTNQNVTALAVSADERVLAGTAGSGIFYSDNGGQTWQPLLSQPGDLHIRDLAVHSSRDLWLAGTATGGAFLSHDQGTSWQSFTAGLDSVGIRAVAIAPQSSIQSSAEFSESFEATRLWAGGIGIVRSPDNLEQIEVRTGDRFSLMSPPDSPHSTLQSTDIQSTDVRRWRVRNSSTDLKATRRLAPTKLPDILRVEADQTISEMVTLKAATDQQQPILNLAQPLSNSYDPATLAIRANVVAATHGETVEQLLAAGDALAIDQQFESASLALRTSPLPPPAELKAPSVFVLMKCCG